jgi:transposase, IS30 family
MHPEEPSERVSHETIYAYIYAQPRGELRKLLIGALRQAHKTRLPRSRGQDRRGRLRDMVSIHDRPLEVQGRQVAGHWEGDLIKGAHNASAVGTLVERKSRFVLLAKVDRPDAESVLEGFTRRLRTLPASLRKTLTYDQGKEMARHQELAERLHLRVYFADPHSPWQRPTNENTNGLLREYLPKGMDFSALSQRYLTQVATALNTRPRKCLGFLTPEEVMSAEINHYPLYEIQSQGPAMEGVPSEVAALFRRAIEKALPRNAYDFLSDDRAWKVALASNFLALSTTSYIRWEKFREALELPFTQFCQVYEPSYLTRIGLRYRDVIIRSQLVPYL